MEDTSAPQGPSRRSSRRGWKPPALAVVAGLVAWLGMCVLLYPMAAGWVSQYNQSKVVTSYDSQAQSDKLVPSAVQQLADAHRYNDELTAGAELEANHRLPTGQGSGGDASLDYNQLLRTDDSGVMGRIKIPTIDVDLPIYHGTADETLLKGIGHLEGTSLPVGGANTHAVLTGHRGLANAVMFTNLDKVKVGDTFTVTVLTQTLTYKVTSTTVVDPDQTQTLRPVAGKDLVTLVTCTPLGINSQRILVTGERVEPTPASDIAAAHKRPDVPRFPWWAVIFLAGTAVVGVYIWFSGRPARPKDGKASVTLTPEDTGNPKSPIEEDGPPSQTGPPHPSGGGGPPAG